MCASKATVIPGGGYIRRAFATLLIVYSSFTTAIAQKGGTSEDQLGQAFKEGYSFKTDLTVRNNVTAQAVLLPYPVAKRIFGTEIAKSYACIEVNIGNKSRDAAFVLHGLFLDYSNWALSGYVKQVDGDRMEGPEYKDNVPAPGPDTLAQQNQTATQPSQVASVEYRLARGQLLDAQQWTARNWTVRLLTLAGSIASGYTFSFKETGISKGIAAFGGTVAPGVAQVWPDGTIPQLERISDFGYQTNKVVTREDGEIVVAFFPIDRFLTPGLRRLFLQSPALFFNPFSIFYDKEAMRLFQSAAPGVLDGQTPKDLIAALPLYTEKVASARRTGIPLDTDQFNNAEKVLYFLSQSSLNTVHIVVDGIMTVDVASIPGKIDTVTVDKEDDPATWSKAGDVTGTIRGSFLSGAKVKIAEAGKLGITDIATMDKGSNDEVLHFKMKLTKAIPSGTTLTVSVVKTDKQGRSYESTAKTYKVNYKGSGKLEIESVKLNDDTVTIKGDGFPDSDKNLTLSVEPLGTDRLSSVKNFTLNDNEIAFHLKSLDLKPACYTASVKTGGDPAVTSKDAFAVAPSLHVKSAFQSGRRVIVLGSGFVDLKDCGLPLKFQLQEATAGASDTAQNVTNLKVESEEKGVFDLPASPRNGKWKVIVSLGDDKTAETDVK